MDKVNKIIHKLEQEKERCRGKALEYESVGDLKYADAYWNKEFSIRTAIRIAKEVRDE